MRERLLLTLKAAKERLSFCFFLPDNSIKIREIKKLLAKQASSSIIAALPKGWEWVGARVVKGGRL